MYYDDFEGGNPLNSHAGEEKLGVIYSSLPCLPPSLVGKLNNVFLSTLVHSKYLKKFGARVVFKKVIEDCKDLSENGITLNINGENQKVYFECVLILGDNLGVNTICGFSESFTANYYCRICRAPKSLCEQLTVEYETYLRDVVSYEMDVLQNRFEKTGIKERCIFNDIKNFHICENISVDVMHDLYEGIVNYTLGKIIQNLLNSNVFSLEVLNNRIESFPYNETEKKNKPRPIYYTIGNKGVNKVKLRQSASEYLCLARYFGLMIGDLVERHFDSPLTNESWKLYKCLRRIIGILTRPELDRGQIIIVDSLIQKHNRLYLKLFGKLKPKMHLWLHYKRVMLLNGPVVHYATLKFERENRKLKEFAVGTVSSINLPITIAIRNQLQLCYNLEIMPLSKSDVILGPIDTKNEYHAFKKLVPHIPDNVAVVTLKYVLLLNKKFSAGTVCVTRIDEDGIKFGLIKKLFYLNNNVYLQIQEYHTLYFNSFYHAYNIDSKTENSHIVVNLNLLPKVPPCLMVIKNNENLVATRYDI